MLSRLIVQSQPLISTAGRNIQKISVRHQIIRHFNRDTRENISKAKHTPPSQSLREKILNVVREYSKNAAMLLLLIEISKSLI